MLLIINTSNVVFTISFSRIQSMIFYSLNKKALSIQFYLVNLKLGPVTRYNCI